MVSNSSIKKVAIVGAGGNCGKYITEALLKTGKHTVTAITRTNSNSPLPLGVLVNKVDYNDVSTLVSALQGQDALIITISIHAQDQAVNLIQAAAEAKVPWILPNEWGFDTANEELGKDALAGPPTKEKRELIDKLGVSSWIAVATCFWYEWSLAIPLGYGFDFDKREVTLYDEGETKINTSTWPQVGRAVASLLSLDGPELEQFRNKWVYVSSFKISQRDMLESVLRVTGMRMEDWKIRKEPSHQRYAEGLEQLKKGETAGFTKLLYARLFYPDGSGCVENSRELHNDVLGLPKENLDEFTKLAIQRAAEVKVV